MNLEKIIFISFIVLHFGISETQSYAGFHQYEDIYKIGKLRTEQYYLKLLVKIAIYCMKYGTEEEKKLTLQTLEEVLLQKLGIEEKIIKTKKLMGPLVAINEK